jgi:cbb3-type cytochrome oxidase maturation protein
MSVLIYLIPAALALGATGLMAFLWAIRAGQFDDPEGAAHRILIDEDRPLESDKVTTEAGDSKDYF